MPPAARILDMVAHPLPPMLTPGPGSVNVFIGGKPAWRGVPSAVAGALSAAKQVSDTAIQAAEAATMAAAGTPGLPAAKAAEEATKAACAASMGSAITAAAGLADIHMCTTPLPLPPHGPGVVIDGSPTVLINNMCACRQGDTILEAVGPPNKIVLGCFTVFIGNGSGGGAATGAPAGSMGMIGNLPVVRQPNGDIKVGDDITITGDNESKIQQLGKFGQVSSKPSKDSTTDVHSIVPTKVGINATDALPSGNRANSHALRKQPESLPEAEKSAKDTASSSDDSANKVAPNSLPAGVAYEGTVYRAVSANHSATAWDVTAGNVAANHRYSGPGQGALYVGTSREAVLAELSHYGVDPTAVAWVSKEVKLGNVLDLTNPTVRQQLGISLESITGDSYQLTQSIGDIARQRYDGILVPSARQAGATNLVIFPKGNP